MPCTEAGPGRRGSKAAAVQVFAGFTGEGYARMDFRVDAAGRIFFLEVNFTCSVFYPEGYQGSADYILAFDGIGQAGFLRAIIDEGSVTPCAPPARRTRSGRAATASPCSPPATSRAARSCSRAKAGRSASSRARTSIGTWSAADRDVFYRYAYPISPEVFVLWDTEPAGLGAAEPLVRSQHGVRRASTWWRGATSAAARN